jgi:hypothetical protein
MGPLIGIIIVLAIMFILTGYPFAISDYIEKNSRKTKEETAKYYRDLSERNYKMRDDFIKLADDEIKRNPYKFGFGLAQIKKGIQKSRDISVKNVLNMLNLNSKLNNKVMMDSLSEVKDLFNRALKQKTWDWYLVFEQFDCPNRIQLKRANKTIDIIRDYYADKLYDSNKRKLKEEVNLSQFKILLSSYLNPVKSEIKGDMVYILKTIEASSVLKIAFTRRSVIEAVEKINKSNGGLPKTIDIGPNEFIKVSIPFGVVAAWRVREGYGQKLVDIVHNRLETYSFHTGWLPDKEIIRLDYREAIRRVNEIIRDYNIPLNSKNNDVLNH